MKSMRYPYILMDADETLFDFKRSEAEAFRQVMPQFGIRDVEQGLGLYQAINEGYWKRFEQGQVTKPQLLLARFDDLFAAFGLECDSEAVNRAYMTRRAGSGFYLLPGAFELCCRLHGQGHKLYIVTNATAQVQRNRFAQSGLTPYFEDVFISEEIGSQKPALAFFQHVFDSIGQPPKDQIIILGDSLTSDMRGGRNADIATCWFNPGDEAPNADCDFVITRLDQFDAIVG